MKVENQTFCYNRKGARAVRLAFPLACGCALFLVLYSYLNEKFDLSLLLLFGIPLFAWYFKRLNVSKKYYHDVEITEKFIKIIHESTHLDDILLISDVIEMKPFSDSPKHPFAKDGVELITRGRTYRIYFNYLEEVDEFKRALIKTGIYQTRSIT